MDCLVPKTRNGTVKLLLIAFLCLLNFACKFSIVSQPTIIEVGTDVEFVFHIIEGAESLNQALVARVPTGWTVVSSTYENSTALPESGMLEFVESSGFICFTEAVPPGYQGLAFFRNPSVPTVKGDSGMIRITFHIDSTPTTPYHTWFGISGNDDSFATCSGIIEGTWNGEIVFRDDFETGDLSNWSSSNP